jgi:hypothetical protein
VKKFALSAVLVVAMAAAAQAQVTIDYTRQTSNSRLRIRYSSGYGYGYGGFYTGFGGSYYAYGAGYNSYYGAGGLSYGFYPGYGYLYTNGPSIYSYGSPYSYMGGYGGTGYYGGYPGYRAGFGRPSASADAAGPVSRNGPVADRIHELAAAREIEEGRRRLKMGDYRGAVDEFRSAVTIHTDDAVAQAWFAVGLAIAGDGRNADKALRAAVSGGLAVDRMGPADFHDDKERAKVTAALSKVSGDGALAAAFALALTGEPAKLKQLAEKDAAARQLLPK